MLRNTQPDEVTMNAQIKIDKVARYKWSELDEQGEFRMINKHDLIIPTDHYQRPASEKKVLRIASSFSWAAFQVISVSDNGNGKYNVIEGGHRTRAALKRDDVYNLPCMVFEMKTIEDEAKAFLEVNVNRAPMSAVDRHHAYIASGDILAIKVENLVRASGRKVEKGAGAHSISCVNELRKCLADDEDAMMRVWPVICALCEGQKITRDVVIGLFWMERRIEGGVSAPAKARRICHVGLQRIIDGARHGREYHGHPGSSAIADGILKQINHGLRAKWKIKDE